MDHRCDSCGKPCTLATAHVPVGNDPWRWVDETRSACCEAEFMDLDPGDEDDGEDALIYGDDVPDIGGED